MDGIPRHVSTRSHSLSKCSGVGNDEFVAAANSRMQNMVTTSSSDSSISDKFISDSSTSSGSIQSRQLADKLT